MQNNETQRYIQEDEIDLRELFKTIWDKKWFIIIFTSVITILAVIYSFSKTPIYEAKALVEIGNYKIDNSNSNSNSNVVLDNTNNLVLELNALFKINNISTPKGTNSFIQITSQAISNEEAKKHIEKVLEYVKNKHNKILLAVKTQRTKEFETVSKQIKVINDIKNKFKNKQQLTSLEMIEVLKTVERLDGLLLKKDYLENLLNDENYINTKVIGNIKTNDYSVKPKKKLIVVVAFVTGFILSIFLVFFMQFIKGLKEDK